MFNFVLNLVFQFSLIVFGNRMSFENQLFYSEIFSVSVMITIPIAVIYIQGTLGFIITSLLIMLQGFANSIFQGSLYGVCGFLPLKFIIAVSMGNGFAGIVMNLIRYIIIAILGSGNDTETIVTGSIIFFSIAVLCLIVGIIATPMLYRHHYFIVHFHKSGEVEEEKFNNAIAEYDFSQDEHFEDAKSQTSVSEDLVSDYTYNAKNSY